MKYSFLIGVRNTLIGFLAFGVGLYLAAHPEVANQNLVNFVTSHLSAVIGTLSVGGAVNLVLDFVHQKYQIAAANRQG